MEHSMSMVAKRETFRHHLASMSIPHRFARDFAHDALGDPDLPEPGSWSELRAYLRDCGACRPAVIGAALAWRSYRAKLAFDGAETDPDPCAIAPALRGP